jgi:hypothetical protein
MEMSEQQQSVEQPKGTEANVQTAEIPVITESVVLPMSEFGKSEVKNATYLKDEEYAKWKEQEEAKRNNPDPAATPTPTQEVVAETPGTTEGVQSAFDEAKWLKEKTEGKFEKWEDLWEKANKEPEVKQPEYKNEVSKTIAEYIAEGKHDEVAEFLTIQKVLNAAEKMSDEEVIKLKMRIEDGEASDDDIAFDFETEFEKPDEDDKRAMRQYERKMKEAAKEARKFIDERKQEVVLPPLEKQTQAAGFYKEQLAKETQEEMAKIYESVEKSLPAITDFKIQFSNEDVAVDYKYNYSDQEKKAVAESLKDYGSFFESRYGTEDGGYDGKKLAEDIIILTNREKIVQSAVSDAIHKERLRILGGIANTGREPVATKIDEVKQLEKQKVQNVFNS